MKKYLIIALVIFILIISSVSLADSSQYMLRKSDKLDNNEIEEISAATDEALTKKEESDLEKLKALDRNDYYEEEILEPQELKIYAWATPQDNESITSSNSLLANGESRSIVGKPESGDLLETIKIYTNNKNLLIRYNARLDENDWGEEATASYDLSQSVGNVENGSVKLNNFVMRLDGPESINYDLYYRVYAENEGWQPWVTSDVPVVEDDHPIHIESLEIRLVPKGSAAPLDETETKDLPILTGKGFVNELGWDHPITGTNLKIGRTGTHQQLKAFSLENNHSQLNIEYEALLQDGNWTGWASNGTGVGTTDEEANIEAVKIKLSGDEAENYDIFYRAHVQNYGWLDWTNNGEPAGTQNQDLRLEGIQVKIVPKGSSVPGNSNLSFVMANNQTEGEVLKNINYLRKNKSLPLLTSDPKLYEIAEKRVKELSEKYAHTRPDDSNFVSILEDEEYRSDGLVPAAGENILKVADPGTVIERYLESKECTKVMTTDYFKYAAFANNYDDELSVTLFADSPNY